MRISTKKKYSIFITQNKSSLTLRWEKVFVLPHTRKKLDKVQRFYLQRSGKICLRPLLSGRRELRSCCKSNSPSPESDSVRVPTYRNLSLGEGRSDRTERAESATAIPQARFANDLSKNKLSSTCVLISATTGETRSESPDRSRDG